MGITALVTSAFVSIAGGVEAIGVGGVVLANLAASIVVPLVSSFAVSSIAGLIGEAGGYDIHRDVAE